MWEVDQRKAKESSRIFRWKKQKPDEDSTTQVASAGGVVMAVCSDDCRHILINATGLRL